MEALGIYLFQMACWLAGFWLVYVAVLRKETFFELNRWFLLFGLVASFTLPLFPIRYNVVKEPLDLATLLQLGNANVAGTTDQASSINYWMVAYAAGVLLFLLRFVWQSAKLYTLRRRSEQIIMGETPVFKLDKDTAPFSFFNSVYISKNLCGETELKTVVAHEKVHIDERHWADLLLLEVARALQWFNPLLILYRKAMMQNHEFLADNGTLLKGVSARTYKAILANQMLGVPVLQIANGFTLFNQNKRILMMNKDKTKPAKRLKLLWVLPVIALLLAAFAKPNYVSGENNNSSVIAKENGLTIKGKVTDADGKPLQGAVVVVKNTSVGTVTDASGNYKLEGIKPEAELVFSYIGFETKVAKVKSELNVSMKRSVIPVSQMAAEMAPPPPPPPPPFTIKGKDGEKPLIVIDGKVSNVDINSIDPNTIEKVEVLKDKSATAVYGDKGKDGVILITTKKEMAPPPPPPPPPFTIKGKNGEKPLIVIDGKVSNVDPNSIDPNTIEKVEVLKDKSATAVYGDKGKDGVVLITTKKDQPKKDEEMFIIVEQPPTFPGGISAIKAYILKNTGTPTGKGAVTVNFTVAEDGSIKNANIVKGLSDNFNKKALEIVYGMPDWKPAHQGGKPVEVAMSIEIMF
jgi:TonB-dependent SusC/RagA subfamily outer membrane receptor